MNYREMNSLATSLYGQCEFSKAMELINILTSKKYPPSFLLQGFIYEFRSDEPVNFDKARCSYLQAAALTCDPRIDIHLSRINMKLGDWDRSRPFMDRALENKLFPDAWFLAGDYFSGELARPDAMGLQFIDMGQASSYYLKAALRGRIRALEKYVSLNISMGRGFRALLSSLVLRVLRPIALITWKIFWRRAFYTY